MSDGIDYYTCPQSVGISTWMMHTSTSCRFTLVSYLIIMS